VRSYFTQSRTRLEAVEDANWAWYDDPSSVPGRAGAGCRLRRPAHRQRASAIPLARPLRAYRSLRIPLVSSPKPTDGFNRTSAGVSHCCSGGPKNVIQAGRLATGHFHCGIDRGAVGAAVKGPLRRPPAAPRLLLVAGLRPCPIAARWEQDEAGSGAVSGRSTLPLSTRVCSGAGLL
jgi:hypothetical protein